MHRGVPHLPVNLEWLVGLRETLVNKPSVGGDSTHSNLLMYRVLGLGLGGDGRIRQDLTMPCWRPSLFILVELNLLAEEFDRNMRGNGVLFIYRVRF